MVDWWDGSWLYHALHCFTTWATANFFRFKNWWLGAFCTKYWPWPTWLFMFNMWVCLKMVSTPKPNGYWSLSLLNGYFIGNINPTFSGWNPCSNHGMISQCDRKANHSRGKIGSAGERGPTLKRCFPASCTCASYFAQLGQVDLAWLNQGVWMFMDLWEIWHGRWD